MVELRNEDPSSFQNFMRMSPAMFDELLNRLTPRLTRPSTNYRANLELGLLGHLGWLLLWHLERLGGHLPLSKPAAVIMSSSDSGEEWASLPPASSFTTTGGWPTTCLFMGLAFRMKLTPPSALFPRLHMLRSLLPSGMWFWTLWGS
ncbi:hypothetical protein O3P69_002283 [Scylla paramamosain]|uniref:Uncharacterized protein n=1 Tax=Scylla paramamosain TaxID=85552 RepID=A0AAW0V614_SCYPA